MSSTCNILYLVNLYLHVLYHTIISYDIYLYISILLVRFTCTLSDYPISHRSIEQRLFLLIPIGTLLIYAPFHIKSTYIAISCSYLHHFLPCIPINFNQVISTLGTTIQFSDMMWAPNAIKWHMVRFYTQSAFHRVK